LLFLLAPPHVRGHHLADDWPRPNDGDLNNNVIELLRVIPWQGSHLSSALDFNHADWIRLLQSAVALIILRQLREVDSVAVMLWDQLQTIFEHSHHAQTKQVHLDDAKIGAVFFVPLRAGAPGQGSAL